MGWSRNPFGPVALTVIDGGHWLAVLLVQAW